MRFCTIAPAAGTGNSAIALRNDNTAFSFYGNILLSGGNVLTQWSGQLSTSSIATADYNFYLSNPTFADLTNGSPNRHSLSQWQGMGLDVHSVTASDPQFANSSNGDYSLLATSPAINAAPIPSSSINSVATDLAGKPRLVDTAYDMGAYEYQIAVGTGSHSFPGVVQAQNVNSGGPGGGYYGASVTSNGIDLPQPQTWAKYHVNFASSSKYYLTASVATGADNESIQFQIDGVNVSSDIAVPNAGWSNYRTVAAENVEVTAGNHLVEVYTSSGGISLQSFGFVISLPGTIPALNIMPGGEGVGYHNIGVGSNNISFSNAGTWAKYQVHVSATGKYYLTAQTATGADNETIRFQLDGVNVTGDLPVPNTGDWNTYAAASAENVQITAGDHVIETYTSSGGINFQSFSLTSSLPGTIQASNVALGGEGTGYHGIGIQPNQIIFSQAGQWANYNVHVSSAGKYHLAALTATGASGETIKFLVDGVDVTGDLPVTNTGSWQTYAMTYADNIELTAGNHVVQAYTSSGGVNLQSFTFITSLPGAIQASNVKMGGEGVGYHGAVVTPTSVVMSQAGQWVAYDVHISASGTYYVFGVTSTGVSGESIQFVVDGNAVTGNLAAPNTGSWNTYAPSAAAAIPLTAGDHVVEVITNSGGLNLQSFTFVNSLPGMVQASNTDLGGEGVGYHGVSISPQEVGFTQAGYWTKYTVNVSASGIYDLSAGVRTGVSGESIQFLVDGNDATGVLPVPNTGWSTYGTATKAGITLTSGSHAIQVYTPSGGFYMNSFTFTKR